MHGRSTPNNQVSPARFKTLDTLFHGAMRGVIPGAFFAFIFLAPSTMQGPRLFKASAAMIGGAMALSAADMYVTKKDAFDARRNGPSSK